MVNDDKRLDIYKIDTNEKINKKRIFILIICIFILLCFILIIRHSIKVINSYKMYKQYETQLQSITYQEEQKQAELNAEKERKRQEKIPKLTETRKK